MPIASGGATGPTRASARAAIVAYFAPPAVPGLCRLYTSFPKSIPVPAYTQGMTPGTRSGVVGIVHLVRSQELRPGMAGKKHVIYECELQLLGRSTQKHSEDAMADFDTVIDLAVARLRADPTLGNPDVWAAGEPHRGIEVEQAEPRLTLSLTETWSALKFDLWHWLTV